MPESLNGIYPEADANLTPHEIADEQVKNDALLKVNDRVRVPTSPIPIDVMVPESELQRLCQRAEDLARGIPHLFDYHSDEEMKPICGEAADAAQSALSALFCGRLSVNPASIQAMCMLGLGNLLEREDDKPLHQVIGRVVSLMLKLKGPTAHLEMALGLKADLAAIMNPGEDEENEPPSIKLPIGFAPPPKKPIVH